MQYVAYAISPDDMGIDPDAQDIARYQALIDEEIEQRDLNCSVYVTNARGYSNLSEGVGHDWDGQLTAAIQAAWERFLAGEGA